MHKILFIFISLFLVSCASKFPAPVDGEKQKNKAIRECPDVYKVKKGETVFSIALKCGFDYKKLALSNGLKKPYFVKPGDQIRFDIYRKSRLKPSGEQSSTNTIPFEEDAIIEDNLFSSEEISEEDLSVDFQFGEPIQIDQPKVIHEKYSKKSIKKAKKLSALKEKNQKNWEWPTDGELTSLFNHVADKKGIDTDIAIKTFELLH